MVRLSTLYEKIEEMRDVYPFKNEETDIQIVKNQQNLRGVICIITMEKKSQTIVELKKQIDIQEL